jgi:hypothetical protein
VVMPKGAVEVIVISVAFLILGVYSLCKAIKMSPRPDRILAIVAFVVFIISTLIALVLFFLLAFEVETLAELWHLLPFH